MASPQRVMITGGNGFIGYAVLVGLLKAGVRAFSFEVTGKASLALFYSQLTVENVLFEP